MFYPVKMAKIRIIGLRKNLQKSVSFLHEYGGVELKRFSTKDLETESPPAHYAQTVEEFLKIEKVFRELKPSKKTRIKTAITLKEALKQPKKLKLFEKLNAITEEKEKIALEKRELETQKEQLKLFKHFNLDFSKLKSNSVEITAGRISKTKAIFLREKIEAISNSFELIIKNVDKNQSMVLIAIDKNFSEEIKKVLEKENFSRENLPQVSGKPAMALKKIEKRLADLNKKGLSLEKKVGQLSKKYAFEVQCLWEILLIEKQRAEAYSNFGRTKDAFVLEAFLPEKNFEELKELLEKKFANKLVIEKTGFEKLLESHEKVPTLLSHSKKMGPFEFMTKFVSIPQSSELDPTLIFAFFFPIIYGMMLGDAGYGLISLLFAIGLIKISKSGGLLRAISSLWAFAALPTIFFGIVFDEYLGFSHHQILEMLGFHGLILYHGLERLHNIEILLPIVIMTGLIIVSIGFFLGFLNELKEKNLSHAIAKISWIALIISGFFIVSGMLFGLFDSLVVMVSGAIFLISLIIIVKVEGIVGAVEVPSVVGNILSFSRILAVGLASVVVAIIINKVAFPSLDQGVFILLTLPIFLFGHAFNTFLGMFESLIQGARLNYVEFFSKFYKGGGKEFSPFKVKRKYTKGR